MARSPHVEVVVVVQIEVWYSLAPHVGHEVQGAIPAAEKVDPATQVAAFEQHVASLGLVAADLLLSYNWDPVHDASTNAPPPRVVSPHVGTKTAADVVNEVEVTVLGVVPPLS